MKKSKFSEAQIVSILKQGDAGVPVKDLCRQAGISSSLGTASKVGSASALGTLRRQPPVSGGLRARDFQHPQDFRQTETVNEERLAA